MKIVRQMPIKTTNSIQIAEIYSNAISSNFYYLVYTIACAYEPDARFLFFSITCTYIRWMSVIFLFGTVIKMAQVFAPFDAIFKPVIIWASTMHISFGWSSVKHWYEFIWFLGSSDGLVCRMQRFIMLNFSTEHSVLPMVLNIIWPKQLCVFMRWILNKGSSKMCKRFNYLYAIRTWTPFLYQINWAGGFPPRLLQSNSTFWPRRSVSPVVYPSIYGAPGGSIWIQTIKKPKSKWESNKSQCSKFYF